MIRRSDSRPRKTDMRPAHVSRPLAAIAASLLVSGGCLAQTFPSKPINLLYSTPPGGSFDPQSRVMADHFQKKWGQPVVIESKPGAGGLVAAAYIARSAAPDGHTLLISASHHTSQLFVKDMPIKVEEVVGVSLYGLLPYQLQISRALNVRTLKDFVAYAKANPGKVSLGAVAAGTHEVEIHGVQVALGFQGNVIPFKGIAPIWLEMVANRLDGTLSASQPAQVKTGEIIPLAIGGEKRHPNSPDVPTFREQGFVHDPVATFYVLAAAAVPRPILNAVSTELAAMAKGPEWESRITKTLGIQGVGLNLDATAQFMRDEYAKLKKIADAAKLVPQ
jgi:tripartite-type tricarboxylate transporter receptor subunit TctC